MASGLKSFSFQPLDWPPKEQERGRWRWARAFILIGFLGVLALELWLLLQYLAALP